MTTGIIYRAFNKISLKSYVGQTIRSLEIRKYEHYRSTVKEDYKFSRALRKYKEDNWEWTVLATVELEKLNEYEIFFIKDLNTCKNGYNSNLGGNQTGNVNLTEYELYHPKHGIIKAIARDFYKIDCKLDKSGIHALITKRAKSAVGWVLAENKDNYNKIHNLHEFFHPDYGIIISTPKAFADKYLNGKTSGLHHMIKERCNSAQGWILAKNKNNYDNIINRSITITLEHPEYGIETMKASEFMKKYNLDSSGLYSILNNKYKSYKKWKLVK